jgi:GDPmannose 4,6-dehydratase
MKKKALITGITGQDGSYLADFLLSKGYEVHGIIRRTSGDNCHRIKNLCFNTEVLNKSFFLHYGDLTDSDSIAGIIEKLQPHEIYNLGAQSHVKVSFDMPEFTCNVNGLGAIRILETIRRNKIKTKYYQASTSEMFGLSEGPQNEKTPFYPRSPYAISKLQSYWTTVNYREAYDIFAVNGILFNHESPRRGELFVTKKITKGISNILRGKQQKLYMGNLDTTRDWGYAPDYVEAMWYMLQTEKPEDYVIGTGKSHSIREFIEKSFAYLDIEIIWEGKNLEEKGIIGFFDKRWSGSLSKGAVVIEIEPKYFRPSEVFHLRADISKVKEKLGWTPKVSFDELIKIMMDDDLKTVGLKYPAEGFKIFKSKGFNYKEAENLIV